MNSKNSQIRVQARYLLDDNIFGKDWTKAAFVHILVDVIIGLIGGGLFTALNSSVVPYLMNLVIDKSIILYYSIPVFIALLELLVLYSLIGPIEIGFAAVYMNLVKGEGKVTIRKFFTGFKSFFANAILGFMFMLQVALWSLFFVVPGIYMAYTYALVFHVKADHPEYSWKYCFDESERLMEGRRFKLFKLQISHIGWFIVGTAFAIIGSFWAEPYLQTSTAIFYEEAKASR